MVPGYLFRTCLGTTTWYLVPVLVPPATRYRVPDTRYLVPGTRYQVIDQCQEGATCMPVWSFSIASNLKIFIFVLPGGGGVLGVGMLPDPPAPANDLPTGSYLRPRKMKFVERFSTSSSSNAINYSRCYIEYETWSRLAIISHSHE